MSLVNNLRGTQNRLDHDSGDLALTTRRIRSFEDLDSMKGRVGHVLSLFSGSLDSSYLLKELSQRKLRISALSVDLGGGCAVTDLQDIAGFFCADLIVIDACEMFANEAIAPAIRAQAKYLGTYPVSSSLSCPIVAKLAVRLARERQCDAIVHTANRTRNGLCRLDGAIGQLGYAGCYGSPFERSVRSREEKIVVLGQVGLDRIQARRFVGNANLWCRKLESGSIDNPERFWVLPSLFEWTAAPETPLESQEIQIDFRAGMAVAIDGQAMKLVALIAGLNRRVGACSIGRYAGLEHLARGEKILQVREAPAATLLMDAYRHLETAVLDAELLREKIGLELLWTREAVEGRWFGALRECADAFIRTSSKKVTGTVRYRLRQGAMDVCSIKSTRPLYVTDRGAWEKAQVDDEIVPPDSNRRRVGDGGPWLT